MSISIIIPAYNEEEYLTATLKRIKDNKFRDYELVVVCNGCTDNSFGIARKYADKVFSLKERNVSKARNFGARNAKHDKLIFLDADVLVDDNLLEEVDRVLEEGKFFGTAKGKGGGIRNNFYLKFKNLVNKFRPWSHGFVYCDKKSFFDAGGFNENLKHGELRDFFGKAKAIDKYKRINGYVEPNDRRIKNWGILKASSFWLFKKDKGEYEAIR
ncbi:glycosyltransferase family 2 protein [Candidatus Woesearchaeota archaeon]|nr:glycosyltransferase family 2 protein [Candidatus Woesearchaeota archaeon]